MSPVHRRQFCKTHSVLGMRSAVCAEEPVNMAETTNEEGAALTEDYHSHVVVNKRSRKLNPDNWKKTRDKTTTIHPALLSHQHHHQSIITTTIPPNSSTQPNPLLSHQPQFFGKWICFHQVYNRVYLHAYNYAYKVIT